MTAILSTSAAPRRHRAPSATPPILASTLLASLLLLCAPFAVAQQTSSASAPDSAAPDSAAARTEDQEAYEPSAAPDDLQVFVDTVNVQVVNVDVYVTDKKGNRVTGLTRDDFELYEDRRPVKITNFYAVEGGRPLEGPTVSALPTGATAAPQPLPYEPRLAEDVPADQRLFLVVYVDNFNIHPANRNRVMQDLGYFLSTEVKPGDEVMLVSYDRSLKVRRPFTADPAVVARSLEELERLTGHASSRDDERRQTSRPHRRRQE